MPTAAAVLAPDSPEWFLQASDGALDDTATQASSAATAMRSSPEFIIRSLRRRLWHALQSEDAETALRAYQATPSEFQQWLHEEDQLRQEQLRLMELSSNEALTTSNTQQKGEGKNSNRRPSSSARAKLPNKDESGSSTSRRSLFLKRKSSHRAGGSQRTSMLNGESTNISYDHASYPGRTLEEGRSVLQSQMNPSEPFIADDYLSPYDMKSYQYPARKDLPSQDPSASSSSLPPQQQHPHSQGRFAAAFHHLFRNRKDTNASNHHGRPVVAWDEDVNRRQHIEATMARTRPTPVPRSLEHQQSISTTLTSLGGAEDETPNASPTNNYASSSSSAVSSLLTTTPLHQAARLGEGNLIRFLLANDGDPNIKNGMARTTLHMVVGGLTKEEGRFLLEASSKSSSSSTTTTTTTISNKKMSAATVTTATDNQVGIASLTIPLELFQQMKDELLRDKNSSRETSKGSSASAAGTGKSAVKAMGRLVRSALKGKEKATTSTTPSKVGTSMSPGDALSTKANSMLSNFDQDRWNHLLTERMDSVLAVLAWYHPETGEGPSINAVDANGRTALHYAAELGRSDVCMAILSNFGAMLTIIDELGARTPCELAGANGYQELAAQLEARALLYIDPYGVDDELMANMLQMEHNRRSSNRRSSTTIGNNGDKEDRRRNQLVAPFHWFETTTLNHVGVERDQRLATTRAKLLKVTQSWDDSQSGMERLMAAAASVGMEAALDGKDEDEASNGATKKGEEEANKTPPAEVVPAAITNDPESSSADDKPSSNLQSAFSHLQEWHVERYLAHHNWSVSKAMKAFKSNPRIAFSGASIPLPSEKTTNKIETDTLEAATTLTCLICYDDEVEESDWVPLAGCVHGFCTDCLTDYLKDCASTKMAFASITCPHHECDVVLTSKEINSLLKNEPDISERIHEATHEQFVTASNDFKFCTHPGCPGVVRRLPQSFLTKHGIDDALVDYTGAVCVADPSSGQIYRDIELPLTYDGVESSVYQDCHSQVQPRQAHRFCFACGDKRHWPVTCQRLDEWRKNIQEEIGTVEGEEQGSGGGDEHTFSELAQKLWIKTNTRPCPKCEVPIEKDDGCNHMTCTNPACRYEFCWICRKDWKLHGTATGGFFRCNIWQEEAQDVPDGKLPATPPREQLDDPSSDQGYGTAIHSAREAHRVRQEMARFVHHYTRWQAHGESAMLEQNMASSVCTRLQPVVEAAMDFDGLPTFNFGGKGLSFVHAAFTELSECRSVLKHSYAFSYFRYPSLYHFRHYGQLSSRRREKSTFERLQSELEMLTEQMSDIVARSHLRATQVQITFLTANAVEKREDFSNLIFSILHDEGKEAIASEEKHSSSTNASRSLAAASRARVASPGFDFRRFANDDSGDDEDEIRAALSQVLGPLERDEAPSFAAVQMWECNACTYMNSGGRRCAMCGTFR